MLPGCALVLFVALHRFAFVPDWLCVSVHVRVCPHNTAQVAFVNDLKHFWNQYDDRVLQLYVLPPLIQVRVRPYVQASLN